MIKMEQNLIKIHEIPVEIESPVSPWKDGKVWIIYGQGKLEPIGVIPENFTTQKLLWQKTSFNECMQWKWKNRFGFFQKSWGIPTEVSLEVLYTS